MEATKPIDSQIYRFGDWRVEPELNRLSRDGEELQLEAKTMDVLAYLIEHHDRIVPAEELLDQVWAERVVEQSTVHRRISQLRNALGDDSKDPSYIQTIVKRGYRAIAPVERVEHTGALIDRPQLARITPPFMAHEGDEPYVFVCYSHQNREAVYAELVRLRSEGHHIWYDEGIRPSSAWTADIARAIKGCEHFVFFVTPDSAQSEHCRNELHFAQQQGKRITVIYLAPTELPDELELQVGRIQAVHKHALDHDAYRRKTVDALSRHASLTSRSVWRWATVVGVALALVIGIGWGFRDIWYPTSEPDDLTHVVVLPFNNTSGDPTQNYVGDAMAEAIGNRLRGVSPLRVIAMTSARAAIDQGLDVRQIADVLNVRYVVEGSVNRVSDEARVSVRVIDTRHGGDVWNERFDRNVGSVTGVFGLYDDISASVASAFDLVLEARLPARPARPENVVAYNLVEQAWYNYRSGLLDRVEPLIDRALEADPDYARAHTIKGWWVRNKTDSRLIRPAADGYAQARYHIERALELDPGYASAHVQLGGMHLRMERDFRLAMAAFEKAEALGVKTTLLAGDKSLLLNLAGRFEEALGLIEAVAADDPLFLPLRIEAVPALDLLGRHDDAQALIEELMRLAPQDEQWVRQAVRHASLHRDFPRARALMRAGLDWSGETAYIEMREGNPVRFRELMERIAQDPAAHPLFLADMCWALKDYDQHLRWIEAAMDEGVSLHLLPWSLRGKPGYWAALNDWALSDLASSKQRLARIAAHRARIDEVTARMVL
jgi:DNA-binding winged helix-turn-helix (wHTH) protein/TolB-like protein/Flp pilus assembly protein TadD